MDELSLSRILVGTDGSARAEEAARQGARIAEALGAALDIVYVVETDRPHDTDVEPEAEAALERAATGAELHLLHVVPVFRGRDSEWTLDEGEESPPELEPAVRAATERGVQPVRDMAMGRPEHALVAAAKRDRSDLLVVGHRDAGGVGRVLLGSVSEHAAEHAPCSVIVARP